MINSPEKLIRQPVPPPSSKRSQNQSTLPTSRLVDINAGSESLVLPYRIIINQLNRVLEAQPGPNATDHSYAPNLDITPEATASRITLLSTSLFSNYREPHPEMELKAAQTTLSSRASGGINAGFIEARNILNEMRAMEGGFAPKIDTTNNLLHIKRDIHLSGVIRIRLLSTGSWQQDQCLII